MPVNTTLIVEHLTASEDGRGQPEWRALVEDTYIRISTPTGHVFDFRYDASKDGLDVHLSEGPDARKSSLHVLPRSSNGVVLIAGR